MYERLANRIAKEQMASLRLNYRRPGELNDCVLDALLGVAYLALRSRHRVVVVGHSFGGAVAINVGAASSAVTAVAALSSQSDGTEAVAEISPRPLLLMQGSSDEVLPEWSAQNIYHRAGEPKHLLLYPGCRHDLAECSEQVELDLLIWLREVLSPG
jgi:alpha-beta hydrolase superfamily lysophospholipase